MRAPAALTMRSGDTIAAISSATGPAARMIVRVSGPRAASLAQGLGAEPEQDPGTARQCALNFSDLRVPAWIYSFRGPRSYTGEDLVEFHLPGSPVLARMLLDELLDRGSRPAEAGEFTARAYFNGRMDLTAAEGVAAAIAAGNEQELAAARKLLAGELARRLAPVMELLADTLALIEVGIDFSEEDVSFLSAGEIAGRIARADEMLKRIVSESARFERLSHEPRVVLAGRPNAGKSTLLNALAGHVRAVVSPNAGTTRDVLSSQITLRRGTIQLIDVAGLEDAAPEVASHEPPTPSRQIARQMREHALRAAESADFVLLVQDATDPKPPLQLAHPPALVVLTKADLLQVPADTAGGGCVMVSALTGDGIASLREHLDRICFGESAADVSLALNSRHVHAIADARSALRRAAALAGSGGAEILALEIRESLDYLGGVLGRLTPDDLLGRIFAGFCIGK